VRDFAQAAAPAGNLAGYYGITAMARATAKTTYPAGEEPKLETLAQIFPK